MDHNFVMITIRNVRVSRASSLSKSCKRKRGQDLEPMEKSSIFDISLLIIICWQ